MQLHLDHWPEWEGETELRQVWGAEDFGPPVTIRGELT
jgi:hypothetical protein